MRVLFYVEPAVFRGNPLFLEPHIVHWVAKIVAANPDAGITWALASSAPLCVCATGCTPAIQPFPIGSWGVLAPAGFDRTAYAQALFDPEAGEDAVAGRGLLVPLAAALAAVRDAFAPDIVIATAQNSVLPAVFKDANLLWIEQAPLPRIRRKGRLSLDPCGHQVGSLIETAHDRIVGAEFDEATLAAAQTAWQSMAAPPPHLATRGEMVCEEITGLAAGRQVALLVLQPDDWLTWEGSGAGGPPETVLARWGAALPAGWVGIPVHHPAGRMPRALEASVAAALPRIALLPEDLGSGVAELALPVADAVITVSSSTAMTAVLSGKRAVVTGRTPFSRLAGKDPGALDNLVPMTLPQRMAMLAFLTHRYTMTHADAMGSSGALPDHLRRVRRAGNAAAWATDPAGWSPSRIVALA